MPVAMRFGGVVILAVIILIPFYFPVNKHSGSLSVNANSIYSKFERAKSNYYSGNFSKEEYLYTLNKLVIREKILIENADKPGMNEIMNIRESFGYSKARSPVELEISRFRINT
ncbi:MAG: hypothetical protein IAE91_12570 [Ignavibacteriaceae bacterium]|nr:hypothetical protein [Ignavibacteriaceae bacterium]